MNTPVLLDAFKQNNLEIMNEHLRRGQHGQEPNHGSNQEKTEP